MTPAASPRRSGDRRTGATVAGIGSSSVGRIGGVVTGAVYSCVTVFEMRAIVRDGHELHKDPGCVPAPVAVAELIRLLQCFGDRQLAFSPGCSLLDVGLLTSRSICEGPNQTVGVGDRGPICGRTPNRASPPPGDCGVPLWLPNEQNDRAREQQTHDNIEASGSPLRLQEPLDGRAKGEPDKTARQRGQDKQDAEREGLRERTGGLDAQVGPNGTRTDQPRFGVDPLQGSRLPEADAIQRGPSVTAAGCGNLPGQPEEQADATPFESVPHDRVLEHDAPQSQGDEEHHQPHPDGDTEEAGQTAPDADAGPSRRENDVAGARGNGRNDSEQDEGEGLLSGHQRGTSVGASRSVTS